MAEAIQITLPDGSVKQVPPGTTPFDIANGISPRLAQAAIAAKAGDELIDLSKPLDKSTEIRLLTEKDPEALQVVRHSCAHVMATAVLELFPETKLGHGPYTETGFFYDFYRPTPFTPDDLKKIEERMLQIVQRDEKFQREWLPRAEGLERFEKEGDFMKVHFIKQFTKEDEKISLYRNGNFVDFCRGPHIPTTSRIKAFKVMNLAGAYWLGDEKNPQLQRIYGTAFLNKKDMDEYFAKLEEAQRRDHRVLGKQLDLFSIQDLAGPGLIFWHPKGGIMRKLMEDWLREEYLKRGYSLVYTPHVARTDLWKTSGHAGYYAQNMFTPMELDDAEYRMKPMNCPFHILIYKDSLKSYRDLPVRLGELGTVYRYERSGVMHGLLRVRGFTQDDAHIFCTPAQIEDEVVGCIDFAFSLLNTYGFKEFQVELSIWDPNDTKSYIGTKENWAMAIGALESALKRKNIPYKTIPGEAAFYGPKIDVKLVDAIGRLWQLSTVQFDFTLPERFGLEYVGEDGQRHQPLMVHRALYGSVERFFGVLIEHYAGAFPAWLSPVQVGIVPISEKHVEYAHAVKKQLEQVGVRVELDARSEKMNSKIRDFAQQKIPFVLVMGDKEVAENKVSVRTRGKGDEGQTLTTDFVARIKKLIDEKSVEL